MKEIIPGFILNEVVIQPGTFCNLDCSYCYIPRESRDAKRVLDKQVLMRLAGDLADLASDEEPLSLLLHAGEPLAVGAEKLFEMLAPFEGLRKQGRLRYSVQTNGTLINQRWCDFFKSVEMGVGVSVDGPELFCTKRVTRKGLQAFPRILQGIGALKASGLRFGVISCLSAELFEPGRDMRTLAQEVHEFFSALKPTSVGFNIEEIENANQARNAPQSEQVYAFWVELYRVWSSNRAYLQRDLELAENFLIQMQAKAQVKPVLSLIPTIDTEGNVYVLSPEIVGVKAPQYGDFIAGNLKSERLTDILARVPELPYVKDYWKGVRACEVECPAFASCQSRHVLSNKYGEHGHLEGTETSHCRNTYLLPVKAVFSNWAKCTLTALTMSCA